MSSTIVVMVAALLIDEPESQLCDVVSKDAVWRIQRLVATARAHAEDEGEVGYSATATACQFLRPNEGHYLVRVAETSYRGSRLAGICPDPSAERMSQKSGEEKSIAFHQRWEVGSFASSVGLWPPLEFPARLDTLEHCQWALRNTGPQGRVECPHTGYLEGVDANVREMQAMVLELGRGITVAVLDTGIGWDGAENATTNLPRLWRHSSSTSTCDLEGIDRRGYNFVKMNNDVLDAATVPHGGRWHGTQIGTILGAPRDGAGLVGIAPSVTVMPVRVATSGGQDDYGEFALDCAVSYAVNHGADILTVSAVYGELSPHAAQAFQYAAEESVLVVASASNSAAEHAPEHFVYPIGFGYKNLIGVTSLVPTENAVYSEAGSGAGYVHLAAPGVDVATANNVEPVFMTGTSAAVPVVAGVAATLMGVSGIADRKARLAAVRQALRDSARPLAESSRPVAWGRLDGGGAMMMMGNWRVLQSEVLRPCDMTLSVTVPGATMLRLTMKGDNISGEGVRMIRPEHMPAQVFSAEFGDDTAVIGVAGHAVRLWTPSRSFAVTKVEVFWPVGSISDPQAKIRCLVRDW